VVEVDERREEDVAKLVVEGFSNRDAAQTLDITEHTVSNYLFKIYEKLTIPREGFPSQNRPCLRTTAPHKKRRRNRKNDRGGAAATERSAINSVLPSTRMAVTW